jgi:hypothetical protein
VSLTSTLGKEASLSSVDLALGKYRVPKKKTLGKELFAIIFFGECSLPSVALGKAFAECNMSFAECL